MKLRYIGTKKLPYILNTPIPFLSRSEYTGEVSFTPEAEVKDEWGQFLLTECAGAFERVGAPILSTDQAPRLLCQANIEQILKYVGKRFSGKAGKWNAIAFIKKHNAETILGLRKLQIVDRVIHWELVPIALADVTAEALDNTWNPKGGKRSVRPISEPDSITVATAGVLAPSIP